jgi:predicted Zn-dependent protease
MAQLSAGERDAALDTFQGLVQANPQTPQYRYLLAAVLTQLGDLDAAERQLEAGLREDRAQGLSEALLGNVLAAQRSTPARLELIERLLRTAPGNPVLQSAKAEVLVAQGSVDEAVALLQGLAATEPAVASHQLQLAVAMRRAGRPEEASNLLTRWLQTHPDDVKLREALAQFALLDGKPAQAADQYRRILELDARHAVALNNLAALITAEEPDAALDYADRALAVEPNNSAFLDTKGVALLAKGDAEQALAPLAQAHADSNDPNIAFHYAQALATNGDSAEARQVLDELLKVPHERPFAKQAEAQALLEDLNANP